MILVHAHKAHLQSLGWKMDRAIFAAVMIITMLIFGIVGEMDYQDQKRAAEISKGNWQDMPDSN